MVCSSNDIKDLIINRLRIPKEKMENLDENANLFGNAIGFSHREVIYFIYDIENKYDINFSEEELMSEDTYTIKSLSEIVNNRKNKGE